MKFMSRKVRTLSVLLNIFWVQRKPYYDRRNSKSWGTDSMWS